MYLFICPVSWLWCLCHGVICLFVLSWLWCLCHGVSVYLSCVVAVVSVSWCICLFVLSWLWCLCHGVSVYLSCVVAVVSVSWCICLFVLCRGCGVCVVVYLFICPVSWLWCLCRGVSVYLSWLWCLSRGVSIYLSCVVAVVSESLCICLFVLCRGCGVCVVVYLFICPVSWLWCLCSVLCSNVFVSC